MYDPIFAKSFSRYDRKRFGVCALTLCLVFALSICSSFKPRLHPLTPVGDAVNLQLSINAVEDMLIHETGDGSDQTDGSSANLDMLNNAAQDTLTLNVTNTETDTISRPIILPTQSPELELPQSELEKKKIEPLCRILQTDADYCDIEGDVRVDPNSHTIYLIRRRSTVSESDTTSWNILPYPRRGITYVRNWTVTSAAAADENIPQCAQNHTLPAVLFSTGGFSGNHFHDFADLIVPLYITSSKFKGEVHFLAADHKPWWPWKFQGILDRLTKHGLLDIDKQKDVHCYNKLIAGLQFQRELIVDPSLSGPASMSGFRQLLQQSYSLERSKAAKWRKGSTTRPRLMIISRKRTRLITNEAEISRAAKKMGYEVVLAEAETSTNLTEFAQLVNSCDVMMGIHGAGLTNMVFLPDNAVLIQVIPLGAIDVFAKLDFGNPAPGMSLRYLEYKIEMRESSLTQRYPIDDPVIKDPLSVHRRGWGELRGVYLDNQNVTVDVRRFKGTLAKALNLLRR